MSRRRLLGCLCSYVNVHGEEAVGRRVRPERAHVERQAMRMAERRQETWRPLNRRRMAAFIQMYLLAIVYNEKAHRHLEGKRKSNKILNEPLVNRIIPYVYRNRVWTMDESMWPLTLEDFHELDTHLADKLPRVRAGHQWQMIRYYYGEIEREREEWKRLEEMEREAGEAVRRVMES